MRICAALIVLILIDILLSTEIFRFWWDHRLESDLIIVGSILEVWGQNCVSQACYLYNLVTNAFEILLLLKLFITLCNVGFHFLDLNILKFLITLCNVDSHLPDLNILKLYHILLCWFSSFRFKYFETYKFMNVWMSKCKLKLKFKNV